MATWGEGGLQGVCKSVYLHLEEGLDTCTSFSLVGRSCPDLPLIFPMYTRSYMEARPDFVRFRMNPDCVRPWPFLETN